MGWLRRAAAACALVSCFLLAHSQARGEAILLDFQTDWCGYCRVMEPVIHELAAEGFHVRTINGDHEPDLVRQFRIEGYPTFVALRDGQEVGRVSGQVSKAQLYALLEKAGGAIRPASGAADPLTGARIRGQSPDGAARPGLFGGRLRLRTNDVHASTAKIPGQIAEGWESAAPLPAPDSDNESANHDRLIATSVRLRIQDHNGQSVGSGTIIDAREGEALILTCGHMFREYKESGEILVDFFGPGAPQQVPAALISYDLNSDVGLVRVAGGHPFLAAKVAPPEYSCRPGDAVVSVGCDNGSDATPRLTNVVSVDRYTHAPNLQVAFEPVQGRSGGGLFNREGQLIGVCNAADAADKQGLFAALGAIYAELDRTNLSFVYRGESPAPAGSLPERARQIAAVSPLLETPNATEVQLSRDEQALLDELRHARGAEVICLVRSLDDPQAKSRVLQINRVSPAFWRELAADSTLSFPNRRLTSLESHLTGGTQDAEHAWSPVTALTAKKRPADIRADRVWPPRSAQ